MEAARKFTIPSLSPLAVVEKWFAAGCLLAGQTAVMTVKTLFYVLKGEIDWQESFHQANQIGVGSLYVVGVTGLFIGFAMSHQVSTELVAFGADTSVGGVVALAIIRELGPITAGVMVAGRVGSAMAAELTTMMISEQIDALKVMRVDPIKFLVVPRFVAALVMIPVLSIYATFLGMVASVLVAQWKSHIPPPIFLDSVKQTIDGHDLVINFIKAVVNAAIIVFLSCAIGLNTRGGAEDVGFATTRAVVWTMTVIFVVNYVITALSI